MSNGSNTGNNASKPGAPHFRLGLAMAGAVSAGAYTAGVVDFLIEALEEWEKAKRGELPGVDPRSVPRHRVVIPVMAGASAGGIASALTAVALAQGPKPVPWESGELDKVLVAPLNRRARDLYNPNKRILDTLYQAWVVGPDMLGTRTRPGLLGLGDLEKSDKVTSLLDSQVLVNIAESAVKTSFSGIKPPYVADPLHLYLTVTNMRGVPYGIPFRDDDGNETGTNYVMTMRGDRSHYRIEGLGGVPLALPFAGQDAALEIKVTDFAADDVSEKVELFYTAALATSAFPVGLAPRSLRVKYPYYDTLRWPIEGADQVQPKPLWSQPPPGPAPTDDYEFVNVDGGAINNQPYEYAEMAVRGDTDPKRGDTDFDHAVIMIEPFPQDASFQFKYEGETSLVAIVKGLPGVLLDQSRFKPEQIIQALRTDDNTRYIVILRRDTEDGAKEPEPYAIASGALGGFGGFLYQGFRDHDYQLGRRNCQSFLRKTLVFEQGHTVVNDPDLWSDDAKASDDAVHRPDGKPPVYRVIPLYGTAALEVPRQPWPQMPFARLDDLQERTEKRAKRVLELLLKELGLGWFARVGFRTAVLSPAQVAKKARQKAETDLKARGQLGPGKRYFG